jgi:hypothetical protein
MINKEGYYNPHYAKDATNMCCREQSKTQSAAKSRKQKSMRRMEGREKMVLLPKKQQRAKSETRADCLAK